MMAEEKADRTCRCGHIESAHAERCLVMFPAAEVRKARPRPTGCPCEEFQPVHPGLGSRWDGQ
jgi:hypothetical protein